jgi:hypothetical protein
MKTPIQELIEKLNNVKPTEFCSIETIKGWAESMLEKEKEVMCEFYKQWFVCFGCNSVEEYYDKTFNTEE